MDQNMFVGTVEKMQGQEADTVLVCYSMWNEEATANSRFIYSLNRFNVGITRGI
jgi:DNA replication ATP-dependent helicase Dna2